MSQGQLITGPVTFITGPGGTVGIIAQTGGAAQGQQAQGSSNSTLTVIGQAPLSVAPGVVVVPPAVTPTNIIIPQKNIVTMNTPSVPLAVRENGPYVSGDANTQFVSDSWKNFSASVAFQLKWGSLGAGAGQFNYPQGIAVAPDASVYVVDMLNNRVQKFSAGGVFQLQFGWLGIGDGEFDNPTDVAIAPDGSVYVVDNANSRVQKFSASGVYQLKWGSWGAGDGQFNSSYGIAVAPDGSVYVTDTTNRRVQKFSASGVFQLKWGTAGTGDYQFNYPHDVGAAPDGSVYITDATSHRVQKFL